MSWRIKRFNDEKNPYSAGAGCYHFTGRCAGRADPRLDFNVYCAKCHRANFNLPKIAKVLEVDPKKLSLKMSKMDRDEMIAITEKGKDKMPGFENKLSKEQIAELIDYIGSALKRANVRPGNPELHRMPDQVRHDI